MKKTQMETFRHQLLKLERHFKGDVTSLEDEAFHRTDGKAVGNLSNASVEDQADLGFDNSSEEAMIGLIENASAGFGKSTQPLSGSTRGPSAVAQTAARKSRSVGFRPSPLHDSASNAPAKHNKGQRHRRAICRECSAAGVIFMKLQFALRQLHDSLPEGQDAGRGVLR